MPEPSIADELARTESAVFKLRCSLYFWRTQFFKIRHPLTHSSNAHAQPSSGAKCLIFGWTLRLFPYFMCANSEGSGEIARVRKLAWAFAGCQCDKYHNLMSGSNYLEITSAVAVPCGGRKQLPVHDCRFVVCLFVYLFYISCMFFRYTGKFNIPYVQSLHPFQSRSVWHNRQHSIESMMGLRSRLGNLRQVFRLFSLMRGFVEHETNNLKTSIMSRPQHHNWFFFSHTIFFFILQQENEVAILSVSRRIQKCNMQNSSFTNWLKENRMFIFAYRLTKLGKEYPLVCFKSVLT